MVYDTAERLARELKESDEYRVYAAAKERAFENETTKQLVSEYHKLQMQAQAAQLSGDDGGETMRKLQKIGELLQFDRDAAQFVMAEYRMNRMLADVYKTLAEAVDVDLSALEA